MGVTNIKYKNPKNSKKVLTDVLNIKDYLFQYYLKVP